MDRAVRRRASVPRCRDAGDPWRVSWEAVAFGLARYGVPVEPLGARASEATHHLGQGLAA